MKYDSLLKSLFQSSANCFVPALTGCRAVEQLSVEFPSIQTRVPDLVMRLEDGRLLHLELQSNNNAGMPRRMLGYWLLLTKRYPDAQLEQAVIYFGSPNLSTPCQLMAHRLYYDYRLVDIRSLPAERFLNSDLPEDRVLALLCGGIEPHDVIRRIFASWKNLPEREQKSLIEKLVIASGLRGYKPIVVEELQTMAISEGAILENQWFLESRRETTTTNLRRLVSKRFGTIPDWANERIALADISMLDLWFDRAIDASRIEDIFA